MFNCTVSRCSLEKCLVL
uniref:Uncharacterized protein n=1 Tax=Arundo donax TaxID=35708 RepID=A0A0A9AVB0_ARUDO